MWCFICAYGIHDLYKDTETVWVTRVNKFSAQNLLFASFYVCFFLFSRFSSARESRENKRTRKIWRITVSHYWMKLGLWLLLNTNMKSYMTFKIATLNLTLCDLERSNFKLPLNTIYYIKVIFDLQNGNQRPNFIQ